MELMKLNNNEQKMFFERIVKVGIDLLFIHDSSECNKRKRFLRLKNVFIFKCDSNKTAILIISFSYGWPWNRQEDKLVFLLIQHFAYGSRPTVSFTPSSKEKEMVEMFGRKRLDQLEVDFFRKYFLGNSHFNISKLMYRSSGGLIALNNHYTYNIFCLRNFFNSGVLGNPYCQLCKDAEEARREIFNFFHSRPSCQDLIDKARGKNGKEGEFEEEGIGGEE